MNKSEDIGELAKALSALQGDVRDAFKGSSGRGHSYADLQTVLEIARPLMKKHELSISQLPESTDASGIHLNNILMHSSGQWLSSTMFMPLVKITSREGKEVINVAQQIGSAISYARRYCLTALLGYTQTSDDDNAESYTQEIQPKLPQYKKPNQPVEQKTNPDWALSEALLNELKELITKAKYTEARVCERFSIDSITKLNELQYNTTVRVCNKAISESEGKK